MELYSYFRSSASYRVRIALNLKGLSYKIIPVHLLNEGGEQFKEDYQNINPMSQLPTLRDGNFHLSQSMAIMQYLDSKYPQPSLFPTDLEKRGLVISLCEVINSGIQPLQNLSVLKYLKSEFDITEEQKTHWIRHWVTKGLKAFEKGIEPIQGDYCFGNQLTALDAFLVPQIFSAARFDVEMQNFPKLLEIFERCEKHPAFIEAHPKNQPDFSN